PAARGQAPVHVAHIIAGDVLARFGIFHAAAKQAGRRRAMQAMASPPWMPRARRMPAQGHKFGQAGYHAGGTRVIAMRVTAVVHGGGTRSSNACTRRSPSPPSACAS